MTEIDIETTAESRAEPDEDGAAATAASGSDLLSADGVLSLPPPGIVAPPRSRPFRDQTMAAEDVFKRVRNQPILTPDHLPIRASAVFNPGVVYFGGEVLLLMRVEDLRGVSHIRVARSRNGVDHWRIDPEPLLQADTPGFPFEEWGCEDARVTKIGDHQWVIAYTAYSRYGPTVALATTSDFVTVNRIGAVLSPLNKDAAVFPRKFDGQYYMLHRPVAGGQEHIWYITSREDLAYWSMPGIVMPVNGGPWWDGLKIGVGAPPIHTEEGWLLIYHGVKEVARGLVYRLGLALLDPNVPCRLTHRASHWIFAPELEFEHHGFAPNVVYTCGVLEQGDDVWMYYGAADTCIGLAIADKADLLRFVYEHDLLHAAGPSQGLVE